jgi:hypothetical protein
MISRPRNAFVPTLLLTAAACGPALEDPAQPAP